MFFASDNAGIVHPKVMDALQKANTGYASPYGADPAMITVVQQIRDLFEAPQAAVYLVATGTAANSIILGTLAQPWETVFCADHAHIQVDECNAPEFYIGGGKLTLIDSADGKFTATD
ncbi:MAG: beta-eliminating lyase-related protein, partial [Halocynthiibacter sp.]